MQVLFWKYKAVVVAFCIYELLIAGLGVSSEEVFQRFKIIPLTDEPPGNNKDDRPVVKLGIILPFRHKHYPWSYQRTIFAIEYAIDTITKERKILPGYKIQVSFGDSLCSETMGPLVAIDMYLHAAANVFLGPVCDYSVAPIARFSPHWNIPIISPGALVYNFRNKTQYQQLTRIGGTYAKLGEVTTRIIDHYGFKKVGLVFNSHVGTDRGRTTCHFIMEAIYYKVIAKYGPKARKDIWHTQFDQEIIMNEPKAIEELLNSKIRVNRRIVVLCASQDMVREIMLKAADLNFINGEYVFFNIDLFSSKSQSERPWYRKNDTDERNNKARNAYQALKTVTLRKPNSEVYHNFSEEVKKRAKKEYPDFEYGEEEVNSFVGAFHDAVILYALALNQTLEEGYNITDGKRITANMWNRTFEGITGNVSIDANGDRNADYSLLDLDPATGNFEVVANYYGNRKQYEPVPGKKIHWAGGRTSPPPDTPTCGFDGSGCPSDKPFPEYAIVIIVLGSLLLIVSLSAFFVYRHYKLETELAQMNWLVKWEDISVGDHKKKLQRTSSQMSLARRGSVDSDASVNTIAVHLSDAGSRQVFTNTGVYKNTIIAIKKLNCHRIDITKPLLMEFKRMRDLQNDHIVRFIGACIEAPNQCILTEYCPKGSLQDVLENDQIKLDWMFRYSLMQDIVKGMAHLHSTEIRSHGNFKSSNCVVDSRFVLKITDFGLNSLRKTGESSDDTYAYYRGKLWTAPELLRMHNPPLEGTQKGDVYSFALICQEIVYRNGPFYVENMDLAPKEIYIKVKNGQHPYFRPTLEDYTCESEDLSNMIKKCWEENPADRPDFHSLRTTIRKLNKGGDSGNILDNLLSRMEQYADNLEALVAERTADYLEEKKRAENLLYMMLPKSVAVQLMRGESVPACAFDSVTIYFSDICGFTKLSSESTPFQVVDLLNDLYTTFDSIIEHFDVYKVETIGDAYMVVSGLPVVNGELHAREIARMSLTLLNAVLSFKIKHKPGVQLKLRIGMHTGSVCAGVVGVRMPRYCLFGDTVNTASRMESNGLPLKIHVSPFTKAILDKFGTFQLELRGGVEMKGKGVVTTYWLNGENSEEHPDLIPKNS